MADFLGDFLKLMKGCSVGRGENIGRDTINGLIVSTVFASDLEVYETAIIDAERSCPVER